MHNVHLAVLLGFVALSKALPALPTRLNDHRSTNVKDPKVLILGGGVAGVIAARTLHENGMDDFLIVEARGELGGRMQNYEIGVPGKQYSIELGPNWIQGTQTGDGPANPILTLARKHHVKNQYNDLDGSVSESQSESLWLEVWTYIIRKQRLTTIKAIKIISTS